MDSIHIIPLQVVFPLFASLCSAMIKNHKLSSWLTIFLFLINLFIALYMAFITEGSLEGVSYFMGGWKAPFGIELKVFFLSELIIILIALVGFISSIYAFYALPHEIQKKKHYLINVCMLLNYTGMVGMLVSNDVFNVYVLLEIASLSSYALIASGGNKEGLISAFEYLIIGTIGATFYLIGVGFIYSISGTLNMSDLFAFAPDLMNNRVFKVGTYFIMLGLMLKSALFPLSNWMIKAYSYSPTFISSFMSGSSTKVSLYLIIKYIYFVFGAASVLTYGGFKDFIIIISLFSVVYGSYFAIKQTSFRMLLAYSSVAQIGYIMFGIALNSEEGLTFSIMQIIIHSITKVPLFIIAGLFYIHNATDDIKKISKLHFNKIKFYYLVLAASLLGFPMTSGFIAKWYLLVATVLGAQSWLLKFSFVVIVLASILPLFYLKKIWDQIHCSFDSHAFLSPIKLKIPLYIHCALMFMIVLNLALGVFPSLVAEPISNNILMFFHK